ncbi:hypothetical protein [Bradyrhizobium liaoningense]
MSHDKNDGNLGPTPIITSPTGRRLKITQGAKLAFAAAVQEAPQYELSGFQKRLYIRLIDRTNEGRKASPKKHGFAFPSAVTLARELGCSLSAVKENLTALETGVMAGRKRKDGTKAADKIIPERWQIKVKRKVERGKGGAGNSNLYWLPLWDKFAAVDVDCETVRDETVRGASETVRGETETVRGASRNGPRRGPDSPHAPTSPTHLNKAHRHFASLIEAGSFVDEADGHSIATSDCMSARQQFHILKNFYEHKFGRPVAENPVLEGDEDEDQVLVDGNWKAFQEASGHVDFTLAVMNIDQAGPDHSFAECVSGKVWTPSEDIDAEEQQDGEAEELPF